MSTAAIDPGRAFALGELAPIAAWWVEVAGLEAPARLPEVDSSSPLRVISGRDPESVTAAAAVCAVVLSKHAAEVTAEVFDETQRLNYGAWMDECDRVRNKTNDLRPHWPDREALLAATPIGFSEIVESIRQAQEQKLATMLDGPVAAAAAVLAVGLWPESVTYIRPLQPGMTPVELFAWEHLRIEPVLRYRTRIGDGELASLACDAINTAVSLARQLVE